MMRNVGGKQVIVIKAAIYSRKCNIHNPVLSALANGGLAGRPKHRPQKGSKIISL